MIGLKVILILSIILFSGALAWGGNHGQSEGGYGGHGGQSQMAKGFQRSQGYGGHNPDEAMGRSGSFGRQFGGDDSRKYRSNLYSDDDIYGYDATYPNGEASYINYKSKEARGRRGPEFKKISRAYSGGQQEGQGGHGNGYGSENGFMGGRAHNAGSHSQNRGGHY